MSKKDPTMEIFGTFFLNFCSELLFTVRGKMQCELILQRYSRDNVCIGWGSSDKGDDVEHFFPHVGSWYLLHTEDVP